MVSKFVIFVALASLAVTQAANLKNQYNPNAVVSMLDREERTVLEVPILGSVILKGLKVGWFLLSTVCSVVGLKLSALAVAVSAVFWAVKNSFSIILGALAMLGFCKLTDKCSWAYVPHQLVDVGESLVYAARNLDSGISKYADKL